MKPARPVTSAKDPLDWALRAGAADEVWNAVHGRLRRRWLRRWGVGVVIAALLAGGALLSHQGANRTELPPSVTILSPARRTLPDSSVALLREGAQIDVQFAPLVRRVILRSGEAHFHVAKDPARPFIVVAHGVQVRAVGTQFRVALGDDDTVDVLVSEGRVTVSALEPAGIAVPVSAGSRAHVSLHPVLGGNAVQVTAEPPADMAEAIAWVVPRLRLHGTPLAEIVGLFNRYSQDRLVLSEPSLGLIRISGLVSADKTAALLHLLDVDFGIEARRNERNELVLSRRPL